MTTTTGLAGLAILGFALGAVAQDPPPPESAEPLPKVLIIGDSISGGYTPRVARLLQDKAQVMHNPGNAEHTGTGIKKLDAWIGETDWEIIHFNWGLWDLCYRHPESKVQGRRDKVRGTLTTPIDVYERNLDQLVARLKQTNATLIWAHTTVVPEGEAGRKLGDDTRYNAAASRVMKKHGVLINDLNALTKGFGPELFSKPGNVHFSGGGYDQIARQVADVIEATLMEKRKQAHDDR
jgi:lysophospholipase L1-like esterase